MTFQFRQILQTARSREHSWPHNQIYTYKMYKMYARPKRYQNIKKKNVHKSSGPWWKKKRKEWNKWVNRAVVKNIGFKKRIIVRVVKLHAFPSFTRVPGAAWCTIQTAEILKQLRRTKYNIILHRHMVPTAVEVYCIPMTEVCGGRTVMDGGWRGETKHDVNRLLFLRIIENTITHNSCYWNTWSLMILYYWSVKSLWPISTRLRRRSYDVWSTERMKTRRNVRTD